MDQLPLVHREPCGPHRLLRRMPVFQFSQGIGVFAVEVLAHLQLANADCIGGQLRRRELEPPNPELRPWARPTTPRERYRGHLQLRLRGHLQLRRYLRLPLRPVPAKPTIVLLLVLVVVLRGLVAVRATFFQCVVLFRGLLRSVFGFGASMRGNCCDDGPSSKLG